MELNFEGVSMNFEDVKTPLLSMADEEDILQSGDYSLQLEEESMKLDDNNGSDLLQDVLEILSHEELNSQSFEPEDKMEDIIKDIDDFKDIFWSENETVPLGKENSHGLEDVDVFQNIEMNKTNKCDVCGVKEAKGVVEKVLVKEPASLESYLLQLLDDSRYASYLHWTCKARKEFQLLNPRQVANSWGNLKNKRKFTPDNLTREIRNLRKAGKLTKLPLKGFYKFSA